MLQPMGILVVICFLILSANWMIAIVYKYGSGYLVAIQGNILGGEQNAQLVLGFGAKELISEPNVY